jgi:O-acetyl-ADP-ribose deacetylase (regulator of RNase III)
VDEPDAWQLAGCRIELTIGDITRQRVDVIANAANSALRGGGGVDGAIHAAAGPGLLDELRRRHPAGTPTGSAVATSGHALEARWVIHAVGPIWRGGGQGEPDHLAAAYRATLSLADELGASSIAFPAISLGIYGYPMEAGARVALATVRDHLHGSSGLTLIRFVLRDATYPAFVAALSELRADLRG